MKSDILRNPRLQLICQFLLGGVFIYAATEIPGKKIETLRVMRPYIYII